MMESFFKKFILFIKFDLRLSTNTISSYESDLNNYIFFLKDEKKIEDIELINFKFPGKRQMDSTSFLNGFTFHENARML